MVHDAVQGRADKAGPADPVTHQAIRQVTFNAWHYAEADLWASVVAELFAQLARSGPPGG